MNNYPVSSQYRVGFWNVSTLPSVGSTTEKTDRESLVDFFEEKIRSSSVYGKEEYVDEKFCKEAIDSFGKEWIESFYAFSEEEQQQILEKLCFSSLCAMVTYLKSAHSKVGKQ